MAETTIALVIIACMVIIVWAVVSTLGDGFE